MAVYDELPADDPRVNPPWVLAGQPRATDDDGLVVILTGQHGDRWSFLFDLPGTVNGDFTVEPDPDGVTLHVTGNQVWTSGPGGAASTYMVFRDLGMPLQRRLKDAFNALLTGWPAFTWGERRCTFYL